MYKSPRPQASIPPFPCTVIGCGRGGANGFLQESDRLNHWNMVHSGHNSAIPQLQHHDIMPELPGDVQLQHDDVQFRSYRGMLRLPNGMQLRYNGAILQLPNSAPLQLPTGIVLELDHNSTIFQFHLDGTKSQFYPHGTMPQFPNGMQLQHGITTPQPQGYGGLLQFPNGIQPYQNVVVPQFSDGMQFDQNGTFQL